MNLPLTFMPDLSWFIYAGCIGAAWIAALWTGADHC